MKIQAVSIDDELINLLVLEEMAKSTGIEVHNFQNPLEAKEYISHNEIDIAFVDYMMNEMNGIEVIHHIRSRFPDVPIIMVTSLAERRDIKLQALEAGANDFLSKPLDSAEFLVRTKNLLTLHQSQLELKNRAVHLEEEVRKATQIIFDREFETLVVLGRAAEYKDPETANHIARVAYTARIMAKALNLSESQQDLIFRSAPLHDIGKMGIPDSLLLKPGALTDEEFRIIKTHTKIGFEILKNSKSSTLKAGAQIAVNHHEKFNGKGYPKGISGNQIPLLARIVTIADCYDAMISKRPYKEPWPLEKVLEEIRSQKGLQFDPELVDIFLSTIAEVQMVYEKLKD